MRHVFVAQGNVRSIHRADVLEIDEEAFVGAGKNAGREAVFQLRQGAAAAVDGVLGMKFQIMGDALDIEDLVVVKMHGLFVVGDAETEPSARQLPRNGVDGVGQIGVELGFFDKIQHIMAEGLFHIARVAGDVNDDDLIVHFADGVGGVDAVHPAHFHIDEKRVVARAVFVGSEQRFAACVGVVLDGQLWALVELILQNIDGCLFVVTDHKAHGSSSSRVRDHIVFIPSFHRLVNILARNEKEPRGGGPWV